MGTTMKNKLSTKRTLEELSANIAGSTGSSGALVVLAKVPEHRRQYLMAAETGEQCRKLAEAGDPNLLKGFLEDVRKLFEQTVNVTAKKAEQNLLTAKGKKSSKQSVHESDMSLEDKIYVLMELWSDEKLGATTPTALVERVSLVGNIANSIVVERKEDMLDETVSDGNDMPLSLLLELATAHYNKEYSGLLSESQLEFMKQYMASEPDQFVSRTLLPLEERASKALGSFPKEDGLFTGQAQTVSALIQQFQENRSVITESRHSQHAAAINFYLSLVELVDRVNSKE